MEKVKCAITGEEKPVNECVLFSDLSSNLSELIIEENKNIQPGDYVSTDVLRKFRKKLFEKIIQKEVSELNELENIINKAVTAEQKISRDINKEFQTHLSFSEKLSDRIASFGGSWRFIISFGIILTAWITYNSFSSNPADPYPFILLNLMLSCIAALQAPIIMMSQNRQEAKDRLRSQHDYAVNMKAEIEISSLNEKLDRLLKERWSRLLEVQQLQFELMQETLEKLKTS